MVETLIRLLAVVALAFAAGKLAAKCRMPAVLGFLIAGMLLGPNAANLLTQNILDNAAYKMLISLMECCMGLMLGSEMVWRKIRQYGKQIIVITFAQSLMTFLVVSLAFGAIFYVAGIPLFLALIFGGIALATAPAPALSIVSEYHTDGPVTRTLIPLAVIDDVIAICVFLNVLGIVMHKTAAESIPGYTILLVVIFPVLIGIFTGCLAAQALKRVSSAKLRSGIVFFGVLLSAALTKLANLYLMPVPLLNFMLMGMVYSAVFFQSSGRKNAERYHAVLQSSSGCVFYPDHPEPRCAAGLPLDFERRSIYCRVHSFPCHWQNGRRCVWRAGFPCACNREKISGHGDPAPFRCIPGAYGHCHFGPERQL